MTRKVEKSAEDIRDELIKRKNKYPYNLLILLGPMLNVNLLPRNYAANTRFLLDTLSIESDPVKIALCIYRDNMKEEDVMRIYTISKEELDSYKEKILTAIKDNLDAIYKGFAYSKIGESVNKEFKEIGVTNTNIRLLNSCGIYNIQAISNLKDNRELIKTFDKLTPEQRGKLLSNLLSSMSNHGYNVKRFGYFGNKTIPHNISEDDIVKRPKEKEDKKESSEETTVITINDTDDKLIKFTNSIKGKRLMNHELIRARHEFTRIWKGIPKNKAVRTPITTKTMIEKIKGLGFNVERDSDGSMIVSGNSIYPDNKKSHMRITIGKNTNELIKTERFAYHLTSELTSDIDIKDDVIYGIPKVLNAPIDIHLDDPKKMCDDFIMYIHVEGTHHEFVQVIFDEELDRWVDKKGGGYIKIEKCGDGNPYSFRKPRLRKNKFERKVFSKSELDRIHNSTSIKESSVVTMDEIEVAYKVLCPHCERNFSLIIPATIEKNKFKVVAALDEFYYCPHCWGKVKVKEIEKLKFFI